MQNPPRSKKYFLRDKNQPWYRSPMLAVSAMVIGLTIWVVFGIYVSAQLEIKPKLLVLRSEGCAYLQLHHILTRPYPIEGTCAAEVPFTYALFGSGGVIHTGEFNFTLSDSQIVAVEPLAARPWTPEQLSLALRFFGSTIVMLVMVVWLFVAF